MGPRKAVKPKVAIVQDPEAPIEQPVLAAAIIRLSQAAQKLARESGLTQRAVVILLQHSTKLSQRDIRVVLDGIEQLQRDYCK